MRYALTPFSTTLLLRTVGLLMDKINVNGGDASPVYQFLKVASKDTSPIMW